MQSRRTAVNNSAFPNPHNAFDTGATLFDYFAAKAMQSLLMQLENFTRKEIPELAYQIAIAMLKERENWLK